MRGALVVAALTSCSHEAAAPAPSATPVSASVGVAPVPVDPVAYTSADEAERLARLDAEETAGLGARRARLDRFAAQRRELQQEELQRELLGVLGSSGNSIGKIGSLNQIGGRNISFNACNACGRG